MDINAYLDRIGYQGSHLPTKQVLFDMHRAHLRAITYENLDIHLGRTLTLDIPHIFDKIVTQHRGGWCYEMNGLFAWALSELGFAVTLLASAVNREKLSDKAERNHLILRVQLERPYLVDVGFGNGFLQPLLLKPGHYQQGFLTYELAQNDTRWFFSNHQYGGPGYDFTLQPRTLHDFADKCRELQTDPESGFVRVVVCHRFTPSGIITLRGSVLRTLTDRGVQDETIQDEATYRRVIREQFDLQLVEEEIATLWHIVWKKHQAYLNENSE
ncbi:MAG TPA: arylamine N-acetyltransferase [Aggregatilineaceae bacterium]|nr:arylamine N-acetyltransferase [Aggregatilineaceae bacterium]